MKIEQVSKSCFAVINQKNRLCDSNSGFINCGSGIVVDTQADLGHAQQLLELVNTVASDKPSRVINTHEDSDHVWGNQLFAGAEIIGHKCLPDRMSEVANPAQIQQLTQAVRHPVLRHLLRLTKPALFALGRQLIEDYDFEGIVLTPPTTFFENQMTVSAGGIDVELFHVGPCHQLGDTIVHVPSEGVVFAGDLVFVECTPMGWYGTCENWVQALDRIIQLKPVRIVPGHGPVCEIDHVRQMKNYLQSVFEQSRAAFDRGLTPSEAAMNIDLGPFTAWNAPSRLAMNVERAYREFRGDPVNGPWNVPSVFSSMFDLAKRRGFELEF